MSSFRENKVFSPFTEKNAKKSKPFWSSVLTEYHSEGKNQVWKIGF